MQELTLRGYRPEDLDALYGLDVVCFEPAFRFSRAAMRGFAEARRALVVVAEVGGVVGGFCIVHVERVGAERVGYVVTLDVAPEWRRQGMAERLMAEVERQAVEAGCAQIALHVYAGNEAARRFYARTGFSAVTLERGFYGRGLDAEVWRKGLVDKRAS